MLRTFRKFEIPVDVFGKQRYTETDVSSHTPDGRGDLEQTMTGRRFARCVRRTNYDSRDL